MGEKPDRDIEKVYSTSEFVAKLRRLADALEAGERFEIQVAGERIYVPARAEFNVEHEREGDEEEIEFQLKWTNSSVLPSDRPPLAPGALPESAVRVQRSLDVPCLFAVRGELLYIRTQVDAALLVEQDPRSCSHAVVARTAVWQAVRRSSQGGTGESDYRYRYHSYCGPRL
jgi:amphi-Trp domain-containing protein